MRRLDNVRSRISPVMCGRELDVFSERGCFYYSTLPTLYRKTLKPKTYEISRNQAGNYPPPKIPTTHGEVTSDPSNSRILFSDWEVRSFTVADMSEMKLDKAEFAYISACHTANTRNFALLDEAIHMAKACQLAGFPTVVGTLWHIPDKDSAGVAKDVYCAMLNADRLDVLKAAKGLHFAVWKIRDSSTQDSGRKKLDDTLTWAAFVHVGA